MHTKEEVKLNLLNFFSNRENKTAMSFLSSHNKCKTLSYINVNEPEKTFKKSNFHRFELKPFHIKDYELMMELSIVKNSDETFSHQISFQSDKKYDGDYSCELYPQVYIENNLKTEIKIINGKIVIQRYTNDYRMNPNYSIELEPKRVNLGIEVDIVNRQYNFIGDEANQCPDHETFTKKIMDKYSFYLDNTSLITEKLLKEIKEEFKRNLDFKKAYEKYNLENLLGLNLEEVLIGMRFLVEVPNVEILFKNAPITKAILYEVKRVNSISETQNTSPYTLLKNGDSLTEMLGFKKDYPRLVSILETIQYGNIIDLRDQIDLLNPIMLFKNEDSILDYFEIIKKKYLRFNSAWFYFGRHGYTLDELIPYFKSVERKQAINQEDAINHLYTVCNLYEIRNGQFKKLFPKSLKLMHDVFKRDINAKVETQKDQIIKNIINKREHLYVKTDDYEILPLFGEKLDKGMVIVNAFTGSEKVLYKSKNSTKYIEIRLYGESIRSISEKVSEKHLENIKIWAKLKNLYIESLDVKK